MEETDGKGDSQALPVEADFVIAYATVPGTRREGGREEGGRRKGKEGGEVVDYDACYPCRICLMAELGVWVVVHKGLC